MLNASRQGIGHIITVAPLFYSALYMEYILHATERQINRSTWYLIRSALYKAGKQFMILA